MKRKLMLAMLIVASCVSAKPTQFNEHEIRNKRSFSWMPTYLGGTPPVAAVGKSSQDSVIAQLYPELSNGDSVSSDGQVINSQLLYPYWDINQYQGLNLQPYSITFMQNIDEADGTKQQTTEPELVSLTADHTVESWLTPELIQMARELGVKDFSKTPSLQDAMTLLGTTSKNTTIEAIKRLAATNVGRALIREYIEGGDNEVAASENVQKLDKAENVEAMENDDNYDTLSTEVIGQYLLPYNQAQLISQFGTYDLNPKQTREHYEGDEIETSTPDNFVGRVTQWANFVNPLTNRQEIPIPQIHTETAKLNSETNIASDEHIANQHTVPIPQLPELPPLPNVPVAEQKEIILPEIPNVHIPYRNTPPLFPYINDPANEPAQVFEGVQQFTNQDLPQIDEQPFQIVQPVILPIDDQTSHGIQLPLVDNTNYEVFRNSPRIMSSYGSPALPYSYDEILSPNTFYISPQASKAYVHQEYEILPSPSEVFKQVALVDEPLQSRKKINIKQEDVANGDQVESSAYSNDYNDKIVSIGNGKVEESQPKQTEAIDNISKEEKVHGESEPIQT